MAFCRASMFLFFSSIWASSVLIPVLIHSCSNKLQFVYLTITSHLACWHRNSFYFYFFYERYFKHLKHKQKHLTNIQLNISKSKKKKKNTNRSIYVTFNQIFLKAKNTNKRIQVNIQPDISRSKKKYLSNIRLNKYLLKSI